MKTPVRVLNSISLLILVTTACDRNAGAPLAPVIRDRSQERLDQSLSNDQELELSASRPQNSSDETSSNLAGSDAPSEVDLDRTETTGGSSSIQDGMDQNAGNQVENPEGGEQGGTDIIGEETGGVLVEVGGSDQGELSAGENISEQEALEESVDHCGDSVCGAEENCALCPSDCGVCADCPQTLMFTEYVEGSGNNKALELYNGTNTTMNLSEYELWTITNGGVWPEVATPLEGNLASGSTWVLCHIDVSIELGEKCDAFYFTDPVNFNGDDAIGLARRSGGEMWLVDQIGEEGGDIGQGWDVAGESFATRNHTLRRQAFARPSINWSRSAQTDWLVYDQDQIDGLGEFTINNQNCLSQ